MTRPSANQPGPTLDRTPDNPTPGIVAIPAWTAHPWLIAGFSTRQGGLSTAYAAAVLPNKISVTPPKTLLPRSPPPATA